MGRLIVHDDGVAHVIDMTPDDDAPGSTLTGGPHLDLPETREALERQQTGADIALVAAHAVAAACEVVDDGWGMYPELGEYDWQAVSDRVKAAHPYPDHDAYLAAYGRMAARAEHS